MPKVIGTAPYQVPTNADLGTMAFQDAAAVSVDLLQVDNLRLDGRALTSTDSNGNIELTPNGTGSVVISKIDANSGTIDGVSIGTNSAVTDLRVDNLRLDGNTLSSTNTNGNIVLDPAGTGSVQISSDLSVDSASSIFTSNIDFGEVNLVTSSGIDSWTHNDKSKSVSGEETGPTGVFFKSDGTKMYVVGTTGDDVNEYNLSTAWDVSTATYSKVFPVGQGETLPQNIFFKPDGAVMYVVGDTNNSVYRYDLSTAWDVGTATYISTYSVGGQESTPVSIYFSTSGNRMYIGGLTGDDITQYNLSTAWDITSSSFSKVFSTVAWEPAPSALSFSDDGTRMYVGGSTYENINQFNLSVPWEVDSAVFFDKVDISKAGVYTVTTLQGMYINESVNRAYVICSSLDRVLEFDTSTTAVRATGTKFIVASDLHAKDDLLVYGNQRINLTLEVTGASTLGTTTVGSTLTASSAVTMSTTTSAINIGTSQTSGTTIVGGTAQTGTITIGRSTGNQALDLAVGATASGSTKTVNLATNGVSGSTTNVTVGSSVSGANGSITLNHNTSVNGSLTISGDLSISGTTTTFNSTTVSVDDPIFTLGGDTAPTSDDNKDRGIEYRWHDGSAAKLGFFGYDDSAGVFTFIPDAANASEVFSGTPGAVAFGSGTFNANTSSTSTVTGTVVVTGGVGISENLWVGGYINVDNLRLQDNTLSSTNSNGNIVLAPNGTGDVQLDADTVRVGDSNANATITTNGTGDLILNTNGGTNSASITLFDAANGAISIQTNGTGEVVVNDASNSSNFRVESNDDQNILFTDGANNRVGVGTGTPSNRLDVVYNNAETNLTANVGTAVTAGLRVHNANTTTNSYAYIDLRSGSGDVRLASVYKDANTSDFVILNDNGDTTLDEQLRITSSGNVGIGTSSPINKLEVSGTTGQLFSVADSMTGTIFSVNDVSGIPSIEVLDTGLVKIAQYSGNVLLGTSTDDGVNKLQVNGSIKSSTFTSTAASGTAPFTVASTTLVTNLNADLLDGKHVGTSGNTVPLLDGTNTWSSSQTFGTTANFTAGGNQILLKNSVNSDPTVIHRNDGTNYYVLLSDAGTSASGTWNTLRPLTVNLTTGLLSSSNGQDFRGGTVFNEDSADVDFRVESNNDVNALFVDGGTDRVGIGTGIPESKLHVRQDLDGINSVIIQNRSASGTPVTQLALITGTRDFSDSRYSYVRSSGGSSTTLEFGTSNGAAPSTHVFIGATGNVGVGTDSPSTKFHVYGGDVLLDRGATTVSLERILTIGGARNSAGGDYASIKFQNYDSNSGTADYIGAQISAQIASDSVDGGELHFRTSSDAAGALTRTLIDHLGTLTHYRAAVFNEDGGNYDFRVEGDTDVNLIFVDASTDRVGIGTDAPGSKLAVAGLITELYNSTYWNVVSQADIGTDPNQVPLNQYLGQLAFADEYSPSGLRRTGAGSDDVSVDSTGKVTISSNISSTSTTTGSLIVTGGLGVSENLWVGGYAQVDNLKLETNTLSTTTGAIGLSPASKIVYFGSTDTATLNIETTSSTTASYPQLGVNNFSDNGGFPVIELRNAKGTSASALDIGNSTILGGFNTWGWGGTTKGWRSATRIEGVSRNTFASDATVSAALDFRVTNANVQSVAFRADFDRYMYFYSGAVINENGDSVDTRIEGDTDENLIFVDASTDRVGIGVATPQGKLNIERTTQANVLTHAGSSLDVGTTVSDGAETLTALRINRGINSVISDNAKTSGNFDFDNYAVYGLVTKSGAHNAANYGNSFGVYGRVNVFESNTAGYKNVDSVTGTFGQVSSASATNTAIRVMSGVTGAAITGDTVGTTITNMRAVTGDLRPLGANTTVTDASMFYGVLGGGTPTANVSNIYGVYIANPLNHWIRGSVKLGSAGTAPTGTTASSVTLDLSETDSATLRLTSTDTTGALDQMIGQIQFYGSDADSPGAGVKSKIASYMTPAAGDGSYLTLSTSDGVTNDIERVRILSSGNVGVGTTNPGYKLEVNGSFAATTKSFVIDHPTKPGKKLRYGSLEGPENGVYVRGKLKGNVIELPEYWTKLVDPGSITVQLTPIGKHQKLYVEDIRDNRVYVANDSMFTSEAHCFYYVLAERMDVDKLEVEIDQ